MLVTLVTRITVTLPIKKSLIFSFTDFLNFSLLAFSMGVSNSIGLSFPSFHLTSAK